MTGNPMSGLGETGIYRDMFGTPEMRDVFSDRALVQAWLDAEAALARAEAEGGITPTPAADDLSRTAQADRIDLEALKAQTEIVGYPILPLVRMLAAQCSDAAGAYVHWGATTQDIMDTAT